ncbi:MAG: WD40 repeat domain-containing protein, partial [Blastocatellia bacterium]
TLLLCEKFIREGCRSAADVEPLIHQQFASLDEALRDPHFNYIQEFIRQRAEDPLVTLKLYRQILNGEPVKDQITPAHIALKLAGLVKRGPNGTLVVRNEIYRRLFNEDWAIRTAESEAAQLRETAALSSAAAVHEQNLIRTMSYQDAFAAYTALKAISVYTGDADELHAQFFERLAAQAEQLEQRDNAILWRLQALLSRKNETRAGEANALIAPDYPNLRFALRHPKLTGELVHDPYVANQIVAFSPDGKRIATAGLDGTARLWSAQSGEPIGQPMRHENLVRAVAFSPDGRLVLTGSDDNTARLWNAQSGEPIGQPMRHKNWVRAAAFSPDGQRVLTGSEDKTARLWSAESGQPIGQPMRHEHRVRAVAFSPDGRLVLTGSDDKMARLWSVESGQPLGQPMRHKRRVIVVAFSPDGQRILTGSEDKTACLWSVESGQMISQPMRHEGVVRAIAFSPEGHRILTGGDDKTARLRSAESGKQIGKPMQHDYLVRAVAFSPDGRLVLTGSNDRTARLWSADSGQPLGRPMRHDDSVLAVAFSPDGRCILTGSSGRIARLWNAETDSDAEPIEGDPRALLDEWQRRLGLKINPAGEIVPLWQ